MKMTPLELKNKVNVKMQIQDRIIRNDDSIVRVPFQTYRIKDVNIYTDATFENRSKTILRLCKLQQLQCICLSKN